MKISWDNLFEYDFKYHEAHKYFDLFPELKELKGLEQGKYHYLDAWQHTVEAVRKFDFVKRNINEFFPNFFHHFKKFFKNIYEKITLKLAILLHDIGKPFVVKISEDGYPTFPEHARYGRELLKKYDEYIPQNYRKNWKEIKYLVGFHMFFLNLYNNFKEKGTKDFEKPIRFERNFVYKLAIVATCDFLATKEKEKIFEFSRFIETQLKNWYKKDITTFTLSSILKDKLKNIRNKLEE